MVIMASGIARGRVRTTTTTTTTELPNMAAMLQKGDIQPNVFLLLCFVYMMIT